MKLSEKPTDYILVTARTNSEWDNCDFAIIYGGKTWNEWLQVRLKAAQEMEKHNDFCFLKFFDTSIQFFNSEEEFDDKILEKLQEKSWAFVDLENGEDEEFSIPENRLEAHVISLSSNGYGKYIAYGKHTGEEFYTESIHFADILSLYSSSNAA